jgi:hypothetical protein
MGDNVIDIPMIRLSLWTSILLRSTAVVLTQKTTRTSGEPKDDVSIAIDKATWLENVL